MEKVISDCRKRAIGLNFGEEYYYLAQCYEDINQFGDPNPYFDNFRRMYFYLKSGLLGCADAYTNLASIIENSDTIKNNRERAKAYFKLAYELGSEDGKHNYFLILKQEEYPTCLKLRVTFYGDKIDCDYLSKVIGLVPNTAIYESSRISLYKGSRYGNAQWQYEFDFIATLKLEPLVVLFKEYFGRKIKVLGNYIYDNDLTTRIDILADINYHSIPSYYMDTEFLSLISKLNGSIYYYQEYFDGFEEVFKE
ncbi:hypothetical protein [Myroides sp.]|uniref:hypothetical protein n=1 Tax=Myroides sp. TaxID=1874736 RepID=UPI0028A8E266|nr:hypothetical protein [Myroides sp.]